MSLSNAAAPATVFVTLAGSAIGAPAPMPNLQAAASEIVKSDAAFAQSVADKNREKFLSFIADVTTFSGGSPNELHGRDAVMKTWFCATTSPLKFCQGPVPMRSRALTAGLPSAACVLR